MKIFRIAFQTIEHPLPLKAESKLDTGGRYLQELFNSYGQIPRKGKWKQIKTTIMLFQSNILYYIIFKIKLDIL